MSQQGYRQASIRAVTGSAEALEGDWHRLFDAASIPAGPFNGRMLAWINSKLGTSYVNLVEAEQALANYGLAYNFSSLGTFTASSRINAPFAKVNGPLDGPSAGPYESWSVEYGSQPTISANVPFTVSRQGYDASGNSTTYPNETMYVVKTTSPGGAVRQPYPNQALQSATTAALSDYIYSTDTVFGGATNNSTFTSPKPVANWATPDRRLVGDTIGGSTVPVEVVAFHRNFRDGKPVACVVFTISDGTNSVSVTVSTPEVSSNAWDLNPVVVYRLPATSISSLTDNTSIKVDAAVYPWIGAAASVANSTASTTRRQFSTRFFYRSSTKFGAPDVMYVSSTGNDATCQVNNSGLPALTIMGAINRLRTGSTGAPWNLATTEIRILSAATFAMSGTASGTSTGNGGALVITRDSSISRANAVVQVGAGALPVLDGTLPSVGGTAISTAAIVFKDVSFVRSGGSLNICRGSTSRLDIQMDQISFDLNANGNSLLNTSDLWMWGVTITNGATGAFNGSSNGQQRIWRGVSMTNPGTLEAWNVLGCRITVNTSTLTTASGQTQDGTILAFNTFGSIGGTLFTFGAISTAVTNGAAIVQNVFETISGSTGNAFAISNDGLTNSTSGVIVWNNTFAGFWTTGRSNLFYDETTGTPRTNKLQSIVGNLFTQVNTKGDVFKTDGTRIGNWAFLYGVGCFGNWTQYNDANNGTLGSSFSQAYAGVGSSYGTSNSTPQMSTAFFTNYQATTAGPTLGAGGGTYSIASAGSGLKIVPMAPLPYDFAGVARATASDTAGAYVAP